MPTETSSMMSHAVQNPTGPHLMCRHATHPADLINHSGTEVGVRINFAKVGVEDLSCCPVCNCITGHQVRLRMERQLPEAELRLRRRMPLCARPQRLHDLHRILQPSAFQGQPAVLRRALLRISMSLGDCLRVICKVCGGVCRLQWKPCCAVDGRQQPVRTAAVLNCTVCASGCREIRRA